MKIEFNKDNTLFDYEAVSWQDAIKRCGKILVDTNKATENYWKSIISNVEKYGSYIMISPGIVIPHTRPEDGALEVGFGLVTIKNKIFFDDNDRDNIKFMLSFTAKDNNEHIEILKALMKIMEAGLIEKFDEFNQLNEADKYKYLNFLTKEEM